MEALLDQTISKVDFQAVNQRCDNTIARLEEQLSALGRRQTTDIRTAIRGIVTGETADDDFYGRLLDHMTVHSNGRVEVALRFLPARWVYGLDGAAQSGSSVPISVSSPFSSG